MSELTQIRIPYYLVFYIALLALIAVLVLSWRNREGKAVKAFIASVALELSWFIGYLLELSSDGLGAKIFWDKFQYIGAIFTPVALLIFALQFTKRKFNLKLWAGMLLSVATVFQLLIFIDPGSGLSYVSPRIDAGVPWDALRYEFGPITNIVNYYIQGLALVYIGILVAGFFQKRVQPAQLGIILLGTAIPTIGVIVAFSFGLKFANQTDVSPLMFAFSSVVLAWGIFRMGLFNVVPIAREILFDSMKNLLIILDQNDRVIDANPAARKVLGGFEKDELIGTHISLLQPELYQEFGKAVEVHTEIEDEDGNTYDFNVTPLYNKRGFLMGRLVNANDITEQKKAAKSLQEISSQNELRAMRLNAISDISQAISQVRDLKTLLPVVTRQISQKFDFYHVGIFLLSADRKYAELFASNSEGGKRMLKRGHRLEIGQVGVVGKVAQDGTPRVALDVGQDAVYFDNPDLPETHSEMALPLKLGLDTIGVLDVQSKRKNIFSEEDTEVFTSLANQVAIAIDNARQVEATRTALEDARSLTQEYVREAWTTLIQQQTLLGYRFTNDSVVPIQEASTADDDRQAFEYPVQLRGETIGVIKVRMSEDEIAKMTENDKALLKAVGDRAGLALESARLLDDAQRRAAREQAIGEVATKISSSTNMETILRNAVQELGQRMGGAEVVLSLGSQSSKKQENDHE